MGLNLFNVDGAVLKSLAEAEKIGSRKTVLIRKLYADSRNMLHQEHDFEKAKKHIKEGLKDHIKTILDKGDEEASRDINEIFKDLKDMGTIEVVLFHYYVQALFEVIEEEHKNKADQLPEVKKAMEELEVAARKFMELANHLGSALQSVGHSG